MGFDWNEYVTLAEELSTRDDEASLRTAISRVYYSIYHQARDFLLAEGISLSTNDSSHKVVWNEYKGRGKSCRPVGMDGDCLHDNRKKADYDKELDNINQLVQDTFLVAKNMREYLRQCKASRAGPSG